MDVSDSSNSTDNDTIFLITYLLASYICEPVNQFIQKKLLGREQTNRFGEGQIHPKLPRFPEGNHSGFTSSYKATLFIKMLSFPFSME